MRDLALEKEKKTSLEVFRYSSYGTTYLLGTWGVSHLNAV